MIDSPHTGSAAILAGGLSRRFGSNKALYAINGRPMISIVRDALIGLFSDVFIAGGDSSDLAQNGIRCAADTLSGKGSLSGIHNALTHAKSSWVFCCGCDMPLIRRTVIECMMQELDDADVVLPVIQGYRQPLHAFYRRNIMAKAAQIIEQSRGSLPQLLDEVQVKRLDDHFFTQIPDFQLSFVSINERQQLEIYKDSLARL